MTICADSIKICALRVHAPPMTSAMSQMVRIITWLRTGNLSCNTPLSSTRARTSSTATAAMSPWRTTRARRCCSASTSPSTSTPLSPAVQSLLLGAPILDDDHGNRSGSSTKQQDCPTDTTPPPAAVGVVVVMGMRCAGADGAVLVLRLASGAVVRRPGRDVLETPTSLGFEGRGVLPPTSCGATAFVLWWHVVQGPAGGPDFETSTGGLAVFLTSTPPPDAVCGFGTVTPGS